MSRWDDVPPDNERQSEHRGGVPVDRILWDMEPVEVDDPAALAAAEAAVRGENSPVIPIDTDDPPPPAGWRALVGWPRLEDQRHRTLAYIGLGSNLGDRAANLAAALRAIGSLPDTEGLGVSRAYESEPWGGVEQPAYANAVAVVATDLRADQLLDALHDIEAALGRIRGGRFGPRTIDLDILLFGDEEWERADLTIPHPRMLERAFVVAPLLEVDPRATMPDGAPVTRERATLGRITGVLGAIPGFGRSTVLPAEETAREPLEFPGTFATTGAAELAPEDAWVAIESGIQGVLMGANGTMTMQIHQGVLESAGIPATLDPPPIFSSPGLPHFAAMERVRLMVPREYEAEARRTLINAQRGGMARPRE
ncbi:MAG: 2-amino-4-hydroxy-6-hydroxymethyldihydropteridine diphosphokinase [Actinomycetota bacterium]|nr:MAG: 2-amino-4-hydroxy-6-hydroxymethyldihydropteridine [Actinomycetota bacterium]MDO8950199.1 2-amino-4-hydroxy-6-hydroxymethyldihydropteridine diphosphokinase [Actinomycetota bacterium]MDP3630040.1 2-amino-4-hydroxy-6-hydroxymethyldihydropteridine diphosphokinase [Actinomycetota bacterium]